MSCGQVPKKMAVDYLTGRYIGSVELIYQQSLLNIGLKDQRELKECDAMVFASNEKPTITVYKKKTSGDSFPPLTIDISAIKPLPDGSTFNIPEQQMNTTIGSVMIGGSGGVTDSDGNKKDGIVTTKYLTFSYSGSVQISIKGDTVSLPFTVFYNLEKQ